MKIGFIALSGVRVVDKELQDIGLNLPGFVERSKVIASLPSLGLLTLAGLTPEHHHMEYIDMPQLPEILPGPFDVVAISSFTAMIKDAYHLADRYRALGTRVILGGLHVALCPDEAAHHADAIVVGEAESVWGQVLDDLEQGCLKPRYHDPRPYDLAQAPMPRFELLDIKRYNRLTVQTSRGCPWHCEFCASSIRLQPRYRTKPVDKIMAEIHKIKQLWARPFIEFADDNTFVHQKHSHELMDALIGENVRWFTETDISVANDPLLLKKMAQAGCAQVLIGFEDPDIGTSGMELKMDWKAKQRPHYLEAISRIQDQGITVNGCFVIGLDSHTPETFERLWQFIQESKLYEIQLTILTPFPGTPLFERLKQDNRLLMPLDSWEKRTLFDITFEPLNMSVDTLHKGFLTLAAKVYSSEFTAKRRNQFMRRKANLRKCIIS
ncbi:B12-binding domain-containing radical SAM protein [Gammaproteobacteria bacterium]|nr:B12-binding domain-containing radical SAM protein [Gammaproteobacteria bacterium]